jgi:hypothetical protein
MKVKQLKEILSEMPDDALVVLAEDPEGNRFSPVGSHNTNMKYLPDRRPWPRGRLFEATQAEFGSQQAKGHLCYGPCINR